MRLFVQLGLLLVCLQASAAHAARPAVDFDNGVVRLGALNDETGPGAAIGRPWALGKRVLVAQVNAGNSDLLPKGWSVELVERDHGYDLERAKSAYGALQKRVLFLLTSFGSSVNHVLLPQLQRDRMIAFPASLDSALRDSDFTPLIGTSYRTEAMRGFDWMMSVAPERSVVRPAIVYRDDRYGADGLAGWRESARLYGVEPVIEQRLAGGGLEPDAVVASLAGAGATHVTLATLPDTTAAMLRAAKQVGYAPIWLGLTASWSDLFFDPRVADASWFAQYYWLTGFPWWGEDHPLMSEFLDAFLAYGRNPAEENFYVLVSWLQGRLALQALGDMLRDGGHDRADYARALRLRLQAGGAGSAATEAGLVPGQARVLRPVIEMGSWQAVADYAPPLEAGAAITAPRSR